MELGGPPCGRAEDEGLADTALVDHLLIELANPPSVLDQVDGVKTTVWDGAWIRDGQPLRPRATSNRTRDTVPHNARPQLRELVGRIAAAEHVEHAVERTRTQLAVRVRPADHPRPAPDTPLLPAPHPNPPPPPPTHP